MKRPEGLKEPEPMDDEVEAPRDGRVVGDEGDAGEVTSVSLSLSLSLGEAIEAGRGDEGFEKTGGGIEGSCWSVAIESVVVEVEVEVRAEVEASVAG